MNTPGVQMFRPWEDPSRRFTLPGVVPVR